MPREVEQQVKGDHPAIFLLFGKILTEVRSFPSVAGTNEKGAACSRVEKPRQGFAGVAILCVLKSVEMVVCLCARRGFALGLQILAGHKKFRGQVLLRPSTV